MACIVAASIAAGSAGTARADGAEAFVGGLLGSAIGTAITNNVQQQKRVVVERRYVRERPVVVNTYQREQNRQVQTALNYFGFPAGPADGVMGGNSRSAVAQYQASVGFAPTGLLMEHERFFLVSSYERAMVGGPQAGQIMAASGQGTRGLLLAYRQEQLGVPLAMPAVPVPAPVVVPVAAAPAAVPEAPAPVPAAIAPRADPVVQAAATAKPMAVPSFMPAMPAASLAALCNKVMMRVSGGGALGLIDVKADMADPMDVLDQQFCIARSHAIDQADSLIEAVDAFTPAEMRTQCEAFAPLLARFTGNLVGRAPAEVGAELRGFLEGTGAQPAQMSGSARICLGIGYSTDNAELALASALTLAAYGETPYGELVGYQLVNGYGVPSDCACGLNWTEAALDGLRAGARPLVADPNGGRADVLAYAVGTLRDPDATKPTAASAAAPAAPVFGLPKAP